MASGTSTVGKDAGKALAPAAGVRLHQAMAQGAQDSGAQPSSGASGIESLASVQGKGGDPNRESTLADSDRGRPVRASGGIGRSSSAPDHGI